MADDSDDSQKTEDPTQKRIEDSLKKGQSVNSKEVVNFLMLVTLALIIGIMLPKAMEMTYHYFSYFITRAHDIRVDEPEFPGLMIETVGDAFKVFAVLVSATIVAALAGNLMQGRKAVSLEPIKPKLEKISLIKGVKRMFSMKSIVEFLKGILKLILIGTIATYAALPFAGFLEQLPGYSPRDTLHLIEAIAIRMMIGVCTAMFFIAAFDYIYQRYEHIKSMKMSFKEIKDEHKEQEGDPMVKAKIRQVRMERAQQRMMSNVPDADVIITNPTHYAVALKYKSEAMVAPKVVAKGVDKVAERIKEVAKEHEIPIVENKHVARSLYNDVDIDGEIPVEYYHAVAEIISYVYRLKGKMQ